MKKYQKPELFRPSEEEVSAASKRLVVESVSKNTTAMTKKQEKIKETYGQYWESGNIDENGWTNSVSQGFLHEIPCDAKEMHIVYGHPEWWYRPKSLSGLEDNNGWASIIEGLPKTDESDGFWVISDDYSFILDCYFDPYDKNFKIIFQKTPVTNITHYQPIVKPKPPIY